MKPEAPKAWVWLILGAEYRKAAPKATLRKEHRRGLLSTKRLMEESLQHGRAKVQSNACLTKTPWGRSAHLWVGEELISAADHENCLSSNVLVPCLLPQLPAYIAMQKATGGCGMVRSHWSPYESVFYLALCTNTCHRWSMALEGASKGCAGWHRTPAWRRSTVKPGMMRSSTSSSACRTYSDQPPSYPNLGDLREKHWHCNDLTLNSA